MGNQTVLLSLQTLPVHPDSVIVGNTPGSGDPARAKNIGRRLLAFAAWAGGASVLPMRCAIPFAEHFAGSTLLAVFLTCSVLAVPSMIGKACSRVSFTTFNTGGDSRCSFRVDFLSSSVSSFRQFAGRVRFQGTGPAGFLTCVHGVVNAPIALAHYLKHLV